MDIKVSYSQTQLQRAVEFISENNPHFLGQTTYIRQSILEYIDKIARDPNMSFLGTMGFLLKVDAEEESMDNDENIVRVEIYVDPGLGDDTWDEEDHVEYTTTIPATEYYKPQD